jgi:hypothetical protein
MVDTGSLDKRHSTIWNIYTYIKGTSMLCLFSFTILQNDENIFKQYLICNQIHSVVSHLCTEPLFKKLSKAVEQYHRIIPKWHQQYGLPFNNTIEVLLGHLS